MSPRHRHCGFTLVELLTVFVVMSVLGALVIAALGRARASADQTRCAAQMRTLAHGVLLYANEHRGEFPRSNHSAFGARQRGWLYEIQPYLGNEMPAPRDTDGFERLCEAHCRCPADVDRATGSSYGLNVYFELNPLYDSAYVGQPATWRTVYAVPAPERTILIAEFLSTVEADHVMAHELRGELPSVGVEPARHGDTSNVAFADGHVEPCLPEELFDAASGLNRWSPAAAVTSR